MMAIAWGEFEDMTVHYLRELAKRGEQTPMLFSKELEQVWGVCTYAEFAEMQKLSGTGMYRPVCAASPDEFMGLLLARFMDFTKEEESAVEKKDISTGKLFSSEHSAVDAGGDQGSEGRRGEHNGGGQEEDNNRTVH